MDTLNHAKRYIQNGWSVIPLLPKKNGTPAVEWKEFQERYATEAELNTWFNGTNNNIGIVTGKVSNLSVLDADGATGVHDVIRLGLASPVTAITGSDGKHLYYRHSGQTNKRTSKDHQGLDVRGEGGFVAAAPSVHPNGTTYRWATGSLPHSSALPEWPKGLLEPTPFSVLPTGPVVKATEPWIVNVLKGVGSGERHQALVRLACYLIPRHHYDIVKQNLLDWNQKNTPPMSESEVVKQLDDLTQRFKKGQYKTTYVAPKEFVTNTVTKSTPDIITAKGSKAYFTAQLSEPTLTTPELATGFPTIDKATYGFTRGELVIIGARPGTGKTSFIVNAVTNLCKNNKRVLYFSTESSPNQMRNKFASSEAGIPIRAFKEHNFNDTDKAKLVQFAEHFDGYDLHFVKLFSPSIKEVQQAVDEIKPDVLVFDHIQHIASEGTSEYNKISQFTKFLKSLAQQTNTAVVVASQLSRSVVFDGVVPELHHLKGCGTLEEEGYVIILMHDDIKKGDRVILFKVAKNRDGETGSTTLMLKADITKFEDMGIPIS